MCFAISISIAPNDIAASIDPEAKGHDGARYIDGAEVVTANQKPVRTEWCYLAGCCAIAVGPDDVAALIQPSVVQRHGLAVRKRHHR